jgi:hypothetical protein
MSDNDFAGSRTRHRHDLTSPLAHRELGREGLPAGWREAATSRFTSPIVMSHALISRHRFLDDPSGLAAVLDIE